MKNRVSTDGKSLELLVSRIYEALKDNPSVDVSRNVKLKGNGLTALNQVSL